MKVLKVSLLAVIAMVTALSLTNAVLAFHGRAQARRAARHAPVTECTVTTTHTINKVSAGNGCSGGFGASSGCNGGGVTYSAPFGAANGCTGGGGEYTFSRRHGNRVTYYSNTHAGYEVYPNYSTMQTAKATAPDSTTFTIEGFTSQADYVAVASGPFAGSYEWCAVCNGKACPSDYPVRVWPDKGCAQFANGAIVFASVTKVEKAEAHKNGIKSAPAAGSPK